MNVLAGVASVAKARAFWWDGGVTLAKLVTMPPAVFIIGQGVTSNISKSYTVKIFPVACALYCSTVFHCSIRVDGRVRLLVVEELHYVELCMVPVLGGLTPGVTK